jgi:FAD/FMN-containing dehydrogenase
MWAAAITGLLLMGCGSPKGTQAKSAATECTGLRAVNADHLAIVGTAKAGKAQSAFQDVEGLAITSGGCLVRVSIAGRVINVYSAPHTGKQNITTFVNGMKSSGEFLSVVPK